MESLLLPSQTPSSSSLAAPVTRFVAVENTKAKNTRMQYHRRANDFRDYLRERSEISTQEYENQIRLRMHNDEFGDRPIEDAQLLVRQLFEEAQGMNEPTGESSTSAKRRSPHCGGCARPCKGHPSQCISCGCGRCFAKPASKKSATIENATTWSKHHAECDLAEPNPQDYVWESFGSDRRVDNDGIESAPTSA